MRRILLATLAFTLLALAAPDAADAKRKRGGGSDNAAEQSRASLQVEWARARAVGGYGNPVTALVDAITGRPSARAGQVQLVILPQEALRLRNGSLFDTVWPSND